MPCEKCGGNNRSLGYENGDEISCKHCGQHLILVGRDGCKKGFWKIYNDVIID